MKHHSTAAEAVSVGREAWGCTCGSCTPNRRWAAFWPKRLRAQPGFHHAHFGIDRATGAIAGVRVFDERPDFALYARLSSEFRETLGQSGPAQAPEFTVYEIAAEA